MKPQIRDSKHILCSFEQVNGFCDGGKGLESIVNIEIPLNKALCICAKLSLSMLSRAPKSIHCNGRRGAVAEYMNPLFCIQ